MSRIEHVTKCEGWAALWREKSRLDGRVEFLVLGMTHQLKVFRTRAECRSWIKWHYGYIRNRPDLRSEPHGWKMPVAVKVRVRIEMVEKQGCGEVTRSQ